MLHKKLWRDLIQNRTQFLAIFLMAFMGIYIFVGLNAEVTGMDHGKSRFYEETNLADLWVMGASFSEEDEEQISSMKEVSYSARRLVVDGKAKMEGEPSVQLNFLTGNDVSKMKIVSGEEYTTGAEGIWLDFNFLKKKNLNIGDTITITVRNMKMTEVIKGSFYHPEYVYYLPDASAIMPEYGKYGFAFLSSESYPDQENIGFNQIIVDLKNVNNTGKVTAEEEDALNQAKEKIKTVLDSDTVAAVDKNQNLSYQTFQSEMDQGAVMAWIFPGVFLLISVLGIITTMTRMTSNQRIIIGTLKALGFSKRKITMHYVSYGFWLSLMGSLVGALLGYFTIADMIIDQYVGTYLVPYAYKEISYQTLIAIALEIAISTTISYFACRKELRYPPAETLKPPVPQNTRHTALEKSKFWLQLSFSTQWNFRDVIRNKTRSLMGVVGVSGCAMLLTMAFGCNDTINSITDWMYGELMTSQYRIIMEESATYGNAADYANEYSGQMIESRAIELLSDENKKTGSLTVLDKGNYMHLQDIDLNKMPLQKKGVAISYKMAESLSVKEGDFVTWHIVGEDKYQQSRITQIYRNPSVQGITMTRQAYEKLEHEFKPTEILTNVTVPKSLADEDAVDGVQDITSMMDAMDTMMELMYMMIGIIVTCAVFLGVVVLYNLGVLSFVEKTREIATLKVLGFPSKAIRRILQKQNIWISSVGILIGLPLGKMLMDVLFQSMPDSMDYVSAIGFFSYLYSMAGTFAVSIGVNYILSRKVKTINMVDALKGVE